MMETLFPLEPLRGTCQALGLPAAAVELWFARCIRNALALDASGIYRSFGEVARATLAVHAWDVHGATQSGLRAGWVSRQERKFHPLMTPPEATGWTLMDVCQKLLNPKTNPT